MTIMKAAFEAQGAQGIVKARAVEERLMLDTWQKPGYDLLPQLGALRIPTLVLTGEQDFIPVQLAEHIARAIPGAKMTSLKGCGHFTYLECPTDVRTALQEFIGRTK